MARRNPYSKMYSISKDGEYLGKGILSELETWLDTPRNEIRKAVSEGKNIGVYEVRYIGIVSKEILNKKIKKAEERGEKPKEEVDLLSDHLEYLKFHIKRYGNTSTVFDPVPYLPDLYDMGYNCRVKEIPDLPDLSEDNRLGRPKKKKVHYYVEVVNETKGLSEGV